jgi:hypothetical protein
LSGGISRSCCARATRTTGGQIRTWTTCHRGPQLRSKRGVLSSRTRPSSKVPRALARSPFTARVSTADRPAPRRFTDQIAQSHAQRAQRLLHNTFNRRNHWSTIDASVWPTPCSLAGQAASEWSQTANVDNRIKHSRRDTMNDTKLSELTMTEPKLSEPTMTESNLFELTMIEGGGCWSISLGDHACVSVYVIEAA